MLNAGKILSESTLLMVIVAATAACGAGNAPQDADNTDDLDSRLMKVSRSLQQPLVIEGQEVEVHGIEERMRLFGVPAVSVAVIDGGRLAAAGAWGVAVAGSDDPVTTETIFQAGSVSKPVAALLTLSLVGDGMLELDQPINEVLQSWKVPDNEFTRAQPVTLRHVITHQAGFTRTYYLVPRSESIMPGMAELLRGGMDVWPKITVESVPGSRHAYSNAGYCVLQLMLEEKTGLSLHELATQRLFSPLGMRNSRFDEPLAPPLLATAASGHRARREEGATDRRPEPVEGKAEMAPAATGGLWSTPTDLATLAAEVMAARQGESDAVLNQELATAFMTPQVANQGLGINVERDGISLRATHNGQMVGFITNLVLYPNAGKGAVVMANSDGARLLNWELMAAIGNEFEWPGFPVHRTLGTATLEQLQEMVGVYALDRSPNIRLTVKIEEGRAIGQVNEYRPFELEPTTESDLFVVPKRSMEVIFERTEDGTIKSVVLRPAGDSAAVYSRLAEP